MNSVSHIILATLLSTGTAVAQETIDFDRHDTDNDGFLTEQEWNDINAAEADFETVDVDGDGRLSEAEVMATQDVELQAEPEAGADFERREVTAEDHAMAQRGRIDRDTDEEDPTRHGAAATDDGEAAIVATDDTEAERETDREEATTDVATDEDEQAGFATAEDSEDDRDEMQAAAGEQGTTDAATREDAGDEDEQAGEPFFVGQAGGAVGGGAEDERVLAGLPAGRDHDVIAARRRHPELARLVQWQRLVHGVEDRHALELGSWEWRKRVQPRAVDLEAPDVVVIDERFGQVVRAVGLVPRGNRITRRCERRIARAEDHVFAEIVLELLLERLLHVDRREHAESLILQRRRGHVDRPFVRDRQLDAQTV